MKIIIRKKCLFPKHFLCCSIKVKSFTKKNGKPLLFNLHGRFSSRGQISSSYPCPPSLLQPSHLCRMCQMPPRQPHSPQLLDGRPLLPSMPPLSLLILQILLTLSPQQRNCRGLDITWLHNFPSEQRKKISRHRCQTQKTWL